MKTFVGAKWSSCKTSNFAAIVRTPMSEKRKICRFGSCNHFVVV